MADQSIPKPKDHTSSELSAASLAEREPSNALLLVQPETSNTSIPTSSVADTGLFEETRDGPISEAGTPSGPAPTVPHVSPEVSSSSVLNQLDVIDGGASSQFARLVRGWETYIQHGTRNVQLGLQNLNLGACGDGHQKAEDGSDLLVPVVLRHTHSSPLNYSTMFDDDSDSGDVPPPSFLNEMRRSISTPSTTSAFMERSAGSAFGTNLRAMPNLTGPDDRSAFSLPMHRATYAMSDPGMHFSAFNPYEYPFDLDGMEQTQIEVTDVETTADGDSYYKPQKWYAATRARRFLNDNVRGFAARRRRHFRGGRENPARPPSTATKSEDDNETISTKSGGKKAVLIQTITAVEEDKKPEAVGSTPADFPLELGDIPHAMSSDRSSPAIKESQYQHLESDAEEEHAFFQRIETIHDSPITSPVYQRFVDASESSTSNVRLQVSSSPQLRTVHSSESSQSGVGRTLSLDSGAGSPGTATSTLTSNTSGQTTLGTNATTSSGRSTMLSSVSETDREVMETNKVARGLRRLTESQGELQKTHIDGDATVHSGSTTSTNTHGYLPLVHSPASLRDGAVVRSERFFKQQAETQDDAPSSSNSAGDADRHDSDTSALPRLESHLGGTSTTTGGSVGNTTSSSSSQSADPPTFVSYLDRHRSSDTAETLTRGNVTHSPPLAELDTEIRESSPEILGSSQIIFEAAEPDSSHQELFRPAVKKRDPRYASRPPLSPIKGLKTPTTPPPPPPQSMAASSAAAAAAAAQSTSPVAYHQHQASPPNIVGHRVVSCMQAPSPAACNLSKPYVLRTVAPGMVLVSPDSREGASNPAVPIAMGRNRTYQESSIEVMGRSKQQQQQHHHHHHEALAATTTAAPAPVIVSPEKHQAGDSPVSSS